MTPLKLQSVRPLVRYVDQDIAVIETCFDILPTLASEQRESPSSFPPELRVLLQLSGLDGFYDEQDVPLAIHGGRGTVRFEVVQPDRWWPASMGEQPLYNLDVRLMNHQTVLEERTYTLGLAHVRCTESNAHAYTWAVNGRPCELGSLITLDRVDENALLPVTPNSLIFVRDHYAPESLYDAADRAGILVLQSVPVHPEGHPERDVVGQINRLASHPSLAGWFVGHLGRDSDQLTYMLRTMDPSRLVLRDLPEAA